VISAVKIGVVLRSIQDMKILADGRAANKATGLSPATNTYLISGIEEVWLGKITTAQFLEKLDAIFKQEQSAGKAPAIPERQ
jgi:raffinose/stachyose/melibiose transport system substrate-binding protein